MEQVDVNKVIEELSQLPLEKGSELKVKELLQKLFLDGVGLIMRYLHQGETIIRSRINNCEKSFSCANELTYVPQHKNKEYQRASTPNQTMFYGTINVDDKQPSRESQLISLVENCKWLVDENSNGFQVITSGIWKVKKDIPYILIIPKEDFLKCNPKLQEEVNGFNEFMRQRTPAEQDRTICVSNFIGEQFKKMNTDNNPYNYLISAIFTELIIKKDNIHGVAYTSAMVEKKQGLNVAITPEIVDDALELDKVVECTIYKYKEQIKLDHEKQAQLSPNEICFDLQPVPPESHCGRERILRELGINSIDDLKEN